MRAALTIVVMMAGSLSVVSGCSSSGFECASDEQCQVGPVGGACQTNGYCSFPDEACPTGQRFGDAAPSGVANTCVEPSEGTGASTSTGAGSTPPDPDEDGKLDSSTADPTADPSTTMALDEGTTTGPEGTSTGSEGTTTGATVPCRSIQDEFDSDAIDPMWFPNAPLGTSITQQGGQLEIALESSPDWLSAHLAVPLGPMEGGWARVMIDDPTGIDLPLAGGITLTNGVCDLQVFVESWTVHAFRWNNDGAAGDQLAIVELPELPVWLQLRLDAGGELFFEWSNDQITWQELSRGTFPECGDITGPLTALVGVGAQLTEDIVGAARRFERFEACVPE